MLRSLSPRVALSLCVVIQAFDVLAAPLGAEEAPGAASFAPQPTVERRQTVDPALVPEVLSLPSAAIVAAETLEELSAQPIGPGVPYRNGFARSAAAIRVEIAAAMPLAAITGSGVVQELSESVAAWSGRFVVADSYAFRVRLGDVALPKGARIWIYAGDLQLGPYGHELLDPEGGIWLPPAPGPEAVVEIELPIQDGAALADVGFTLGEVMELVADPLDASAEPLGWTDCDIDAMCVSTSTLSTIDMMREAMARLIYVKNGSSFLCSGGLINDKDLSGFRPYLLTANHCFSTQSSASSLVAYFDYRTNGCNGSTPSLFSVPSVAGATLLATGATSDFTFVELSANPSGTTWYLGWTTTDPASGSSMYRVSHPAGTPQKYSAASFVGGAGILCTGLPTSDFHYSRATTGSTTGGSSGAPVTQTVSGDARVVGQLFGVCRFSTWDECNAATFNQVDGAFSTTYPSVSFWINDSLGCADAYEPDGSAAQASPIVSGAPQTHGICPAGEEDWVTFTLGESSAVTLETSGASGDTRLWLFNSALSLVEFDDDDGDNLFSAIDRLCGVDPLPAGTYYAMVDEFGDDGQIAGYQLAYTRLSCASTCPVNRTLSNTTIGGIQTIRASGTIALGPSLIIAGTDVTLAAGQRIVIGNGTRIGGSFTAMRRADACTF